jgi:radical SAM superfamily enzyme YgiQ (UPF0313 family)
MTREPDRGATDPGSMLRRPGSILLVSCYELGRQPLSIASPLALLREAGFSPAALDLAVQPFDREAVERADLVAISVPMHTALHLGMRAAERTRALNPGCHLCFYGLYATLNADSLLAGGADSILGGEYEEPLLCLARSLSGSGGRPPEPDGSRPLIEAIPGVTTRAHAQGPWIRKVRLAVPSRQGLPPLDRYARLEADGVSRVAGQVEASRGCLHRCRHCPIPPVYEGTFFVVPRDLVLADARSQVAAGAEHLTFGDPDFLNGPGHSMALLRELHAEFPALTFDLTAKVEHLLKHRRFLPEMARLGCLFIVSAVESLSDEVLLILDKGHNRAGAEEALRLVRAAGISLRPSFVPFTPWTRREDYEELLDFIEAWDLIDAVDPVQLSIRLLLPPGSLLLDRPEIAPFLGPLDRPRATHLWIHPDAAMDRLQREVASLVEERAVARADPLDTFGEIRRAAGRLAARRTSRPERAPHLPPPPPRRDKGRPPRLSEPWFC